jgi:hypothetical protein
MGAMMAETSPFFMFLSPLGGGQVRGVQSEDCLACAASSTFKEVERICGNECHFMTHMRSIDRLRNCLLFGIDRTCCRQDPKRGE